MEIAPFVEALQRDLAVAAAPTDVPSSRLVERISAALEASIRLRLLEAVSQAAAELAPQVDGVVFVIRASFTSARIARAALDLLYQRRVNILGLALNAVAADSSEYYYYKYKSYYTDSPKRAK